MRTAVQLLRQLMTQGAPRVKEVCQKENVKREGLPLVCFQCLLLYFWYILLVHKIKAYTLLQKHIHPSARKVNFCDNELKESSFLLFKMLYYHLDFCSTLLLIILMCSFKFTVCCILYMKRIQIKCVLSLFFFLLIGQSHKIFGPFFNKIDSGHLFCTEKI